MNRQLLALGVTIGVVSALFTKACEAQAYNPTPWCYVSDTHPGRVLYSEIECIRHELAKRRVTWVHDTTIPDAVDQARTMVGAAEQQFRRRR